jgi:hypothetical protein
MIAVDELVGINVITLFLVEAEGNVIPKGLVTPVPNATVYVSHHFTELNMIV